MIECRVDLIIGSDRPLNMGQIITAVESDDYNKLGEGENEQRVMVVRVATIEEWIKQIKGGDNTEEEIQGAISNAKGGYFYGVVTD